MRLPSCLVFWFSSDSFTHITSSLSPSIPLSAFRFSHCRISVYSISEGGCSCSSVLHPGLILRRTIRGNVSRNKLNILQFVLSWIQVTNWLTSPKLLKPRWIRSPVRREVRYLNITVSKAVNSGYYTHVKLSPVARVFRHSYYLPHLFPIQGVNPAEHLAPATCCTTSSGIPSKKPEGIQPNTCPSDLNTPCVLYPCSWYLTTGSLV